MPAIHRIRGFRRRRSWRGAVHGTVAVVAALFLIAEVAAVGVSTIRPARAKAAQAPPGQGFTVTPGDLAFILKQIKIAEHHSAALAANTDPNLKDPCLGLVGPGPNQIPDRLTPYGLRTVDGSCNNLFPSSQQAPRREFWAASDQVFPRLAKPPAFRDAERAPAGFFGPDTPEGPPTSYAQTKGNVFDSQPRVISNLIVDQTSTNPAAIEAAGHPVRTQDPNSGVTACAPDGDPSPADPNGNPDGCVPAHKTLFIPNVTTDVGLSPPYNSVFTFFGQFFDHGVDQTVKSGGTVFVPLKADDPLRTLGPDGDPTTNDAVRPENAFMVLTRAENQPGPDGVLGDDPATEKDESADDVQDATNTDTPLVDQSQTYTSHASHQVFVREYTFDTRHRPVATGRMMGDPSRTVRDANGDTGMATWASVKKQAAELLGLQLRDKDVLNVPMLATDPYGEFIPGPARGLPQYVTKDHGLVEGVLDDPDTPANEAVPVPDDVVYFDTPFVGDIAHNADPSPQHGPNGEVVTPTADTDTATSSPTDRQPAGTFDNELLDTHFLAGDGRVNENIALTAIHQIFHSEHDRLVEDIKRVLTEDTSSTGQAALPEWQITAANGGGADGWNGDRLFQAARFITEMEYQHLVFEDFARKIVPAIRPFHIYNADVNPVVPAEFAHAVYRFGHSMLDDTVARTNVDPDTGAHSDNSLPLLTAFLNPPEYFNGHAAGTLTPEQAAGSIFMGSADQTGNEIDEFVTETLRNNLLGLPLDLPTINMARAREAGVPPLNLLRKEISAETNDSSLKPYTSWSDFGQHLKHPESLINFVAAYGKHPTITDATTLKAKRDAARAIVNPVEGDTPPEDAADFMFSTGATWGSTAATGLDDVDLWVGGLSEVTNLFGGLLGSTFNYVFQHTLEDLQEGDRLYYLNRTPGLNLRTQLEGNSFTELVERNTQGTDTFKADAFATADCKFMLSRLEFPAVAPEAITGAGSVKDDPLSECNENALLLRKPDGTFQYRLRNSEDPPGINGQSVYQGSNAVVDRVFGGNDNDTIWGAGGNDILDGGGGDDNVLGGEGNDVITDLDGLDVLEGGADNDAIDSGPGDDLILGGDGSDFSNGGLNDNETFAGPGDDFIIAGAGADVVFGDGGDDWVEGGSGQDLLQGDHGAPFFDDPGESHPGHEVMIGQVGENDYDVEGGDDLMSQNSAVDRNAGAGGFDWAFHQYDTVGADDDMKINQVLDALPLPLVVNRDRWQETEADSGSAFNDIIRGDDDIPSAVGGGGFTGCDALDQAGVDRIRGLDQLVATLPTPLATVTGVSATGTCPLSGNVWAEGNILLGGAGGDTIEGRGGDDIIDGDRVLNVGISVRDHANRAQEIGRTDLMEHQYRRDANGQLTGPTLQADVFAGNVDPGDLVIEREILSPPTTPGTIDTAVFSGPRANYTLTLGDVITVRQDTVTAPQRISDGTDTLRNVERLQFSDQTVVIGPAANVSPTPVSFGTQGVGIAATRNVTLSNTGTAPLTVSAVELVDPNPTGQFSVQPGVPAGCSTIQPGASCTIPVRFQPTATGLKSATLRLSTNSVLGGTVDVPVSGTGAVNSVATGAPVVHDQTPQVGQTLTAITTSIADADGLGPFTYRWEASATAAFGNPRTLQTSTSPTYTVRITDALQFIRVVVTFTDQLGFAETRVGAPTTSRVSIQPNVVTPPPAAAAAVAAAAPAAPAATPLGQALAPVQTAGALAGPIARALAVSARAGAPLTVSATVPAGATTVRIRVFRLGTGRLEAGSARSRRHVATVVRRAPKAGRYRFRLTERALRHLKPGRYLVEVRVGSSARRLGPAAVRTVVVGRRAAVKAGKAIARR
jgi:Ca2+-binding RTX toxin-like protein